MSVNGDVLDRCCLEMEEALSSVYRFLRVMGNSIVPLEIRLLWTFEELMDYSCSISRDTSIRQYNVPRCVTEKPHIIMVLHWGPSNILHRRL